MLEHDAPLRQDDPGAGGAVRDLGTESGRQPLNPLLARLSTRCLVWLPERGCGYYEVEDPRYDEVYFDRFAEQAETPIGKRLMAFRTELVNQYTSRLVVDVGIGSGAFIKTRGSSITHGYDVNPKAIAWLQRDRIWIDLYANKVPAATFWDVLEHIREPEKALAQVLHHAFVSVPIFRDPAHVLDSRHYRKDEHYWYWTRAGFIRFANECGFAVDDILATESAIGRDEIETFVLVRESVA